MYPLEKKKEDNNQMTVAKINKLVRHIKGGMGGKMLTGRRRQQGGKDQQPRDMPEGIVSYHKPGRHMHMSCESNY